MPKTKLTEENPRDVIPRNIKVFMAMRGMTPKDVAKRIGVTASTVNYWLSGKITLDVIRLDQIAKVLKTTPATLYSKMVATDAGEGAIYIGGDRFEDSIKVNRA